METVRGTGECLIENLIRWVFSRRLKQQREAEWQRKCSKKRGPAYAKARSLAERSIVGWMWNRSVSRWVGGTKSGGRGRKKCNQEPSGRHFITKTVHFVLKVIRSVTANTGGEEGAWRYQSYAPGHHSGHHHFERVEGWGGWQQGSHQKESRSNTTKLNVTLVHKLMKA